MKRYGHLLAKTTPRVIKTDADNEWMLAVVDKLMRKGEGKLTPEEDALLELLVDLIHDYEVGRHPIPKSPHEMLSYLLDQKRLMPKDLWAVVESKSRVSEILSGKRSISKEQARRLAAFFQVSVALFI